MGERLSRDEVRNLFIGILREVSKFWIDEIENGEVQTCEEAVNGIILDVLKVIDDGIPDQTPQFILMPHPSQDLINKTGVRWPIVPSDIVRRIDSDIAGLLAETFEGRKKGNDLRIQRPPSEPREHHPVLLEADGLAEAVCRES